MVPISVTLAANQISPKRTPSGDAGRQGRVRCPRAGLHHLRSRAARASCLPALRPACEVHRCDRDRRCGTSAAFSAVSREAWPELSPGTMTPWDESRGGTPAGERARKRKGGASRFLRGATRAPLACGRYCPASAGVPLPFFLSCVARMSAATSGSGVKARRSSPDIAPLIRATGYGLRAATRFLQSRVGITRARNAPRERDSISPLPGGERSSDPRLDRGERG